MSTSQNPLVEALFKVGAHFGYARSRRHATMKSLVFGVKNKTDILDLTQTAPMLESVLEYVKALAAQGKTLLFVSGKPEMATLIRESAASIGMPFVAGRWLGGTLSNFTEIKKRMNRMKELIDERDSGTSVRKYTKKERLMIDREIARLEENFSGLVSLDRIPEALVVVDTRREDNAVKEARGLGVPVIGIANSDCDLSLITHPVVGNDASRESVQFFLSEITRAYQEGRTKGA
ncbi:MAG: 30S ribosomal protein S2 [Candidatus Pacebacteria bacterium]|jgi:small subunit ribosomal protein S2|nr:30S ribosomal protein S2 [Candidatus Paceibacterota bacterium]